MDFIGDGFFYDYYELQPWNNTLGLNLSSMHFWEQQAQESGMTNHFSKIQRTEIGVPIVETDGSWKGRLGSHTYWEWKVSRELYELVLKNAK